MTKPIPDEYRNVTPFIVVDNANGLIEFIGKAFGGTTRFKMDAPGGKVGHAEVMVGDSAIMIADPDERDLRAPAALHVYVDDVDRVFKTAVDAGGKSAGEPETHFYGDRSGCVADSWGNRWYISTHVEDVSPEEMTKRMAKLATA